MFTTVYKRMTVCMCVQVPLGSGVGSYRASVTGVCESADMGAWDQTGLN